MRTARGRMATRKAYLHFGLQGAGARAGQPAAVRGRASERQRMTRILLARARLLGGHRWRRRRLLRQLPQVHGARAHRVAARAGPFDRASSPSSTASCSRSSRSNVNYRSPARLDDELLITCVPRARRRGARSASRRHDLARRRCCSPKATCAWPASMRRRSGPRPLPRFHQPKRHEGDAMDNELSIVRLVLQREPGRAGRHGRCCCSRR